VDYMNYVCLINLPSEALYGGRLYVDKEDLGVCAQSTFPFIAVPELHGVNSEAG